MIQHLLGVRAAVTNGYDRVVEFPSPPAKVSDALFGIRLLPARIDAHGNPVFRLTLETAETIPCVRLRKAGDSCTIEEAVEAASIKLRVGVCYETLNPDAVSWFDRAGRPVDAESARCRLVVWHPVLLLPSVKESYFDAMAKTLLDCFRPDLLIAVIRETTLSLVEQDKSPASKLVSAVPIPTRVRIDDLGRVVFRPGSIRAASEHATTDICDRTAAGGKTKIELSIEVMQKVTLSADELAVQPKYVQFFNTEGKSVEAAVAVSRLAKETTVLVSGDGKKVNPFYLKAAQPDTLVCVLPFDIANVPPPKKLAPIK